MFESIISTARRLGKSIWTKAARAAAPLVIHEDSIEDPEPFHGWASVTGSYPSAVCMDDPEAPHRQPLPPLVGIDPVAQAQRSIAARTFAFLHAPRAVRRAVQQGRPGRIPKVWTDFFRAFPGAEMVVQRGR